MKCRTHWQELDCELPPITSCSHRRHTHATVRYRNFLLASSAVLPSDGIPDVFPTIPCRLMISWYARLSASVEVEGFNGTQSGKLSCSTLTNCHNSIAERSWQVSSLVWTNFWHSTCSMVQLHILPCTAERSQHRAASPSSLHQKGGKLATAMNAAFSLFAASPLCCNDSHWTTTAYLIRCHRMSIAHQEEDLPFHVYAFPCWWNSALQATKLRQRHKQWHEKQHACTQTKTSGSTLARVYVLWDWTHLQAGYNCMHWMRFTAVIPWPPSNWVATYFRSPCHTVWVQAVLARQQGMHRSWTVAGTSH